MGVIGYSECRCGELVLEQVWLQTGGRCVPCFRHGIERNPRIFQLAGRQVTIPGPRRRPGRGSKGSKRPQHQKALAERAALRKLRAMYPEVYRALLVIERAERGVPLLPPTEGQTSAAEALYAAATDRGADPCPSPLHS